MISSVVTAGKFIFPNPTGCISFIPEADTFVICRNVCGLHEICSANIRVSVYSYGIIVKLPCFLERAYILGYEEDGDLTLVTLSTAPPFIVMNVATTV